MSLIGKESEKERERQGGVLKKVFSCQQISKIAQSLTLSLPPSFSPSSSYYFVVQNKK